MPDRPIAISTATVHAEAAVRQLQYFAALFGVDQYGQS
jgi:hypothetical protein